MVGGRIFYNSGSWSNTGFESMAWINKLYFVDKSNGWAVGPDYSANPMDLISYYNGTSWTIRYTFTDVTTVLNDIFFRNTTEGWSVGCTSSPRQVLIVHTTDGGTSWTKQLEETPASPGALEAFNAVYFSSDGSTGFAVGNNKRIYKYY